MNLGENIYNAFDVIVKTYENINKLMNYCKAIASEKGEFVLITPKFLRFKSDNNIYGWAIQSFILLFQSTKDDPLENDWRDGPVYLMEINLYEPDVYNEPMVNIAKYEYENISSWSEGCSPSNHWIFYQPLHEGHVDFEQEGNSYFGDVADNEDADKRYWGLRRITGLDMPLTEITNNNAYEKIFGGFRSLMDK